MVFVVQRPAVAAFRPLGGADPAFAELLKHVHAAGIDVRAVVTPAEKPRYGLREADLPVERS